jgi:hypothetical protein
LVLSQWAKLVGRGVVGVEVAFILLIESDVHWAVGYLELWGHLWFRPRSDFVWRFTCFGGAVK